MSVVYQLYVTQEELKAAQDEFKQLKSKYDQMRVALKLLAEGDGEPKEAQGECMDMKRYTEPH
eukprot:2108616-Karenia_brevis.AAC.1